MKTDGSDINRLELWEIMKALPGIIEQLMPVEKIALRYVLEDKLKRLDKAIELDNESAEFWELFKDIHRGTFEDRMRTMRIHSGRSSGDKYDLTHTFRDINIEIEIDQRCREGMTQKAAIDEVANIANLSPDRVKKIYQACQRAIKRP